MLVAAHGNSLRALIKHLDGVSDADIVGLNVPTGVPLVYELDAQLRPLGTTTSAMPTRSRGAWPPSPRREKQSLNRALLAAVLLAAAAGAARDAAKRIWRRCARRIEALRGELEEREGSRARRATPCALPKRAISNANRALRRWRPKRARCAPRSPASRRAQARRSARWTHSRGRSGGCSRRAR